MSGVLRLSGHAKDLGGGFTVRRLLPAVQCRSVGPFIFFDHFGPVSVVPGAAHDVRPHPHIGLATVTYLFSGAIMHRDNLGYVQQIEPGAINWMTAGNGIVHSERRPESLAETTYVNHGIQLWAALPVAAEEVDASFVHTPAAAIPEVQVGDAVVRVLIGTAFDQTSPVATYAPTLYLDVQLRAACWSYRRPWRWKWPSTPWMPSCCSMASPCPTTPWRYCPQVLRRPPCGCRPATALCA